MTMFKIDNNMDVVLSFGLYLPTLSNKLVELSQRLDKFKYSYKFSNFNKIKFTKLANLAKKLSN